MTTRAGWPVPSRPALAASRALPSREPSRAPGRRGLAVLHAAAAVAVAALCLSGCFVVRENVLADEALPGGHVRGIRRGTTTRQEILERFGPPTAIARRGPTMAFPPPGPAKRGRTDVPSATFFELFSPGRTLRDSEIVYYYDSSRLKATGFLVIPLIGVGYHTTETVVERLWLLVDDSKGIVEDYVFRGAE